jgi:hypothetical protein
MGQRSNYVAVKDAQIIPNEEECVLDMGQRSNDAAVKDAQIKFEREECVLDMGQKPNDAAVKDAQINRRKEEYVVGTGHTATPLMNLQLLHHVLDPNFRRLRRHIPTRVMRPLQ